MTEQARDKMKRQKSLSAFFLSEKRSRPESETAELESSDTERYESEPESDLSEESHPGKPSYYSFHRSTSGI